MATPLFVWLGSGRARRRHVPAKGQYLDQAARAGLPVPAGAILLDDLWGTFLKNNLVAISGGRAIIPDPELFHNTLFYSVRLPRFNNLVAIRAAVDGNEHPIPPCLNLDMNDTPRATSALAEVWTAILSAGSERMDILVMDMIHPCHSGTAISLQEAGEDEVIPSAPEDKGMLLSRSSRQHSAEYMLPDYARRLRLLLRGTRRTFGKGDWRIDWLDDGRICYLIQIKPMAITE